MLAPSVRDVRCFPSIQSNRKIKNLKIRYLFDLHSIKSIEYPDDINLNFENQ